MNALVFCDLTDVDSYLGAVRFERAVALHSILTGQGIEVQYRAFAPTTSTPVDEAVKSAKVTGIDLNIDDIIPAVTDDAWRLATWASAQGAGVQRDFVHQLWRAHFLEGADLGDPLVLTGRAALAGLDLTLAEEVLAEVEFVGEVIQQRETAQSLGATVAPFIVVDGVHTIVGLQSQDQYVAALRSISEIVS